MNTAAKGRRQEHRSMEIFEAAGYHVIRGAASKANGWDFAAYSATDWVLVSVKSGDWPPPMERRILAEQVVPPNTKKILHRWRERARLPDWMELSSWPND
jgi:hypothetical protein